MGAKIIAALALLLALAGLGLWGQHEHLQTVKAKAEVTALKTRNDALQGALDASVKDGQRKDAINLTKQVTINKLAAQAATNQKALDAILKINRSWADAPLPDGLRASIGAAPSGEAAPGPGVDGASPRPADGGQR